MMNLTSSEVAARLRISKGTLANWRTTGEGPRFIKFGKTILYPESELLKFERKHTYLATSVLSAQHPQEAEDA